MPPGTTKTRNTRTREDVATRRRLARLAVFAQNFIQRIC